MAIIVPDYKNYGAAGDFITAPELTPLFGQALANQCQQILPQLNRGVLFEFGAGSGRLCVDLLSQLERNNGLPENYYILEVSSNLRHRQQELIQQEIPHLFSKGNLAGSLAGKTSFSRCNCQ